MEVCGMKYYVIQLSTGEYDDWAINTLFIVDKEYKAKFYCSKGNAIIANYIDYYKNLCNELLYDMEDTHPRSGDFVHISNRYSLSIGNFGYHEIEFRKDVKVK